MDLSLVLPLLVPPKRDENSLSCGGKGAGAGPGRRRWVLAALWGVCSHGLTEIRDSRSFSTKFSGGRIPKAGLLMNVLCKKGQEANSDFPRGRSSLPAKPAVHRGMGSDGLTALSWCWNDGFLSAFRDIH